jgi:hypothetical protein
MSEEEKHIDKKTGEELKTSNEPPGTTDEQDIPASPDEIISLIEEPVTEQDMEVHHHPTIEKKNFKEYLLEGLMIFIAVTLGFFAENLREHIAETHREKEFAQELYTELKTDSITAADKLAGRLDKEKDMDYLNAYFKDSSLTDLPKKFYPAYIKSLYLINRYAFEPKDGILSQLRNSGAVRYFKSVELQKLLGDISVAINNIRYRNEQEYQYFASPIKPFLLKYCDFNWLDILRKKDTATDVVGVINNYLRSNQKIEAPILNLPSFDRAEAANLVVFYKQMLVSTRSLQLINYIIANQKILQALRENYSLKNE